MTVKTHQRLLDAMAGSALVGGIVSLSYLALGLARNGGALLEMSPSISHAVWVLVASLGLYGLGFLVVASLLSVLIVLVSSAWRRTGEGELEIGGVAGILSSGVVLLYLTVWWQLDVITWLPLRSTARLEAAALHFVVALLGGAVFGVATSLIARRLLRTGSFLRRSSLTLLLIFVAFSLASRWALAPGKPEPGSPQRVAVIGFDGMTFRVLGPLLRQGQLPTFQTLIDRGAWGTFLTHGTASSPLVWTSMATGQRTRDHGITDFLVQEKGAAPRPVRSTDRTAAALWNIASDAGLSVAVVNWLVTYPPESVNGAMVPRLDLSSGSYREGLAVHPTSLSDRLRALLERESNASASEPRSDEAIASDRIFDVLELLIRADETDLSTPDLVMSHDHSVDTLQHRNWNQYQPESYDAAAWDFKGGPTSDGSSSIVEIYRQLDHRLGRLMNELPDDTLLMVVSDHGQRARRTPQVRLKSARILKELGYLESRAYALTETPASPVVRINLRVDGREPQGTVTPAEAAVVARGLIEQLAGLEVDGLPLFETLTLLPGAFSASTAADIEAVPSAALIRRAGNDPAFRDMPVALSGLTLQLDELITVRTDVPGVHERQGVIFLHGPSVRPGPIGQRVVTTALQELVWSLTDKVALVDRALPYLQRLGLLDRATTLDVAPTVLRVLDLPMARDMEGRVMSGFLSGLPEARYVDHYQLEASSERFGEEGDSSSEAELEQLRELGYIDG